MLTHHLAQRTNDEAQYKWTVFSSTLWIVGFIITITQPLPIQLCTPIPATTQSNTQLHTAKHTAQARQQ